MNKMKTLVPLFAVAVAILLAGALSAQQGFKGKGKGFGQAEGAAQQADMQLFHYLLDHRQDIQRRVTKIPGGVETLTESANPEVAAKIQAHVASMYQRVEEQRPIHARDPLFAEVFRNAPKIKMKLEKTEAGVKIVETSDDPYVARLIQAHAEVVNLFLKNGRAEAIKNHAVPAK